MRLAFKKIRVRRCYISKQCQAKRPRNRPRGAIHRHVPEINVFWFLDSRIMCSPRKPCIVPTSIIVRRYIPAIHRAPNLRTRKGIHVFRVGNLHERAGLFNIENSCKFISCTHTTAEKEQFVWRHVCKKKRFFMRRVSQCNDPSKPAIDLFSMLINYLPPSDFTSWYSGRAC